MNRNVAYPFFLLSDSAVAAERWQIALGESAPETAGDYLKDWDYAATVTLTRNICVDFESAAADLRIPVSDLSLEYLVEVGSGAGRLPRKILETVRCKLPEDGNTIEVRATFAGSELSTVLTLKSSIILAAVPAVSLPGTPARIGDRLWKDEHRIRLEGDEPRFPLEVTSFSRMFGDGVHAAAPWYVNWDTSDWRRDFHGAVRLYINEDQTDFVKQIEKGNPFTLRMILADVIGQIVERMAMEDDADVLMEGCEAGTLGAQVKAWIGLAWPGKSLAFVKALLENRPGLFRAAILVIAQLPGER